jgi:hypothetical protein
VDGDIASVRRTIWCSRLTLRTENCFLHFLCTPCAQSDSSSPSFDYSGEHRKRKGSRSRALSLASENFLSSVSDCET